VIDDEALARHSRQGSREAFEELVRRTAGAVHARLYLETGDVHLAEDLAQETFLTAWRSIRSLTNPQAFRPWLFSIAHSTLLDSIRRQSRKKRAGERVSSAMMEQIPDSAPDPSRAGESHSQQQQMLAALRSMPEEYRNPLMLRYLSGADYETIGRELAISNGSLRGLLSRGMTMLREKMKNDLEK
jgi:RNA polymerase sigma-70 factor (ECF subfamily)